MEELSSTLVKPSPVTVIGVVKDVQQTSNSTPDMKNRKHQSSEESTKSSKETKAGSSVGKGSLKKSLSNTAKFTTDNKLEQLDQKWSERFSLSTSQSQRCFHLW